jgi:hypothetical protein
MGLKLAEPYFDPVSQGICEVLGCSSPAKFRVNWAQGMVVKLVCNAHKPEVEGKVFQEISLATFGNVGRSR